MGIYHETNEFLVQCFHELEESIPSPVPTQRGSYVTLRYKVHRLEIAIIQKLARYVSGLNASLLLLEAGFTQELGTLFRTLDEFNEDIVFLSLPIVGGINITDTHTKYLDQFFQEEFDNPDNAILSTQKREPISRRTIRAAIANSGQTGLNPHDSMELSRTISQAYSGYVHGASCHICEMVDGKHLKYHLTGMPGSYRQSEFIYNYWDYAYRGLITMVLAAKVLCDENVLDKSRAFIDYFEKTTGDTGRGDVEKMMKRIKRKKPIT